MSTQTGDSVKGVDEAEQVEKLATVLVHEGNFPSHASALDAARSLYKAGVRHHV